MAGTSITSAIGPSDICKRINARARARAPLYCTVFVLYCTALSRTVCQTVPRTRASWKNIKYIKPDSTGRGRGQGAAPGRLFPLSGRINVQAHLYTHITKRNTSTTVRYGTPYCTVAHAHTFPGIIGVKVEVSQFVFLFLIGTPPPSSPLLSGPSLTRAHEEHTKKLLLVQCRHRSHRDQGTV